MNMFGSLMEKQAHQLVNILVAVDGLRRLHSEIIASIAIDTAEDDDPAADRSVVWARKPDEAIETIVHYVGMLPPARQK